MPIFNGTSFTKLRVILMEQIVQEAWPSPLASSEGVCVAGWGSD